MKSDVFISYSHADEGKARAIADFLQKQGFRCWIDHSGIRLSEGYDEKIAGALREARVVLWLASKDSVESDYVQHEISTALAFRKPIGPIYLEPLGPEALRPPFDLSESRVHGIEYFKEPVEEKLATLLDDLRPLVRRRERVRTLGLAALALAVVVALGWLYRELASPTKSAPERPMIAVLPFENLGADASDEALAQGIAQNLVRRLTDFRALQTKSDAVGARYLVTGSVLRSGERVRIDAQLADAEAGRKILWAHQFDEELRDILKLQDHVAEAIVGQVAPELLEQERGQASRMDPDELEAFEAVLQGDWRVRKLTSDDVRAARALYQKAAELDPHLAEAFGGLAMSHVYDVIHGWSEDPRGSLEQAQQAAKMAVERDRRLASAHGALGATYLIMGMHEQAVTSLERAKELFPSYAIARSLLATALALEGRGKEAVASIESAIRLSPNDAWMFDFLSAAALAHFSAGNYEEALRYSKASIQRNPDYPPPHYVKSASLRLLGRADDARAASEQAGRIDPQGRSRQIVATIFESADPDVRKRWKQGSSGSEPPAER